MVTETQWTDRIRPGYLSNILCVIFGVLLWMDFLHPQDNLTLMSDSLLFNTLTQNISGIPTWTNVLNVTLFLIMSFIVLRMNEFFLFIPVRTVLPSLFCVMFGGLILVPHILSAGVIVAFLLLLAVWSAMYMTQSFYTQMHAFNIGFLLAVGSLFFPWTILFIVPFFYFYYNFNLLSFRSILATLTGAFLPLFYAVLYLAVVGKLDLLDVYLHPHVQAYLLHKDLEFSAPQIAYFVIVGLILVWALFKSAMSYSQDGLKQRRMSAFFVQLLLTSVLLMVFTHSGYYNLLCFAVLLISVVLGRFFSLSVPQGKPYYVALQVLIGASVIFYINYLLS